jgi:4-nitrophenyl phosphatase
MTSQLDLGAVRAVLLDMDGVLYVGDAPLPGVQDFFDYLDATGRAYLCVTNNASRTPASFADKLRSMGVTVSPEHIFGSAQATAMWLREQVDAAGGAKGPVIMLGMEGLRVALLEAGFELTTDPFAAAYAVAGAAFNLTYDQLADVTLAIRNGAQFVGTNPDTSFPSERGQVPGTGSILKLLEAASGVSPSIVGKPNAAMFEIAMHRLGVSPHETLMVGDRYETDIAGAVKLGLQTVAVLTGISTAEEFASAEPPPDVVMDDLPALHGLFLGA